MNNKTLRPSATGTIPRSLRTAALVVLVGLFSLMGILGACGRVGTTSRTGPDDEMAITRTETGYQVTLDEEECMSFRLPELNGIGEPRVSVRAVEDGWQRVSLQWEVSEEIAQDELSVLFDLTMQPDFWWAPHLAPDEGYVVAQHVFRSPALIVQQDDLSVAIVPDLDLVGDLPGNPWFLDFDAPARQMWLGMVLTDIPAHVLYTKRPGMTFEAGEVELAFYIRAWDDQWGVRNPWAPVASFLWERWGTPLLAAGEPVQALLGTYARRTYDWAFDSWGDYVWQEFEIDGTLVGAPQFIVNISQSPN